MKRIRPWAGQSVDARNAGKPEHAATPLDDNRIEYFIVLTGADANPDTTGAPVLPATAV